jgi:hypothetical protein
MLLALKLALVPGFLAALTMAGRVWGPSVAGWLAALPVVAGPIVLLLAQGATRRLIAISRKPRAPLAALD